MEGRRILGGSIRGRARDAGRLVVGSVLVPAALVVAVLSVTAAPVSASVAATTPAGGRPGHPGPPGPEPEVVTVGGPFTATAQLLGDCGTFHQIVDGQGEWSGLGASTLHVDFCIGSPPDGLHYPVLSGTFTITAADGTLTGTVSGDVRAGGMPPPEEGFPFHLDLAITGGTERFARATGTLALDGAFSYGALSARGTIAGEVTIPPGPPTSVDDCRHGGWRRHVDDHGRPFRSKRHCIRYVVHHGGG